MKTLKQIIGAAALSTYLFSCGNTINNNVDADLNVDADANIETKIEDNDTTNVENNTGITNNIDQSTKIKNSPGATVNNTADVDNEVNNTTNIVSNITVGDTTYICNASGINSQDGKQFFCGDNGIEYNGVHDKLDIKEVMINGQKIPLGYATNEGKITFPQKSGDTLFTAVDEILKEPFSRVVNGENVTYLKGLINGLQGLIRANGGKIDFGLHNIVGDNESYDVNTKVIDLNKVMDNDEWKYVDVDNEALYGPFKDLNQPTLVNADNKVETWVKGLDKDNKWGWYKVGNINVGGRFQDVEEPIELIVNGEFATAFKAQLENMWAYYLTSGTKIFKSVNAIRKAPHTIEINGEERTAIVGDIDGKEGYVATDGSVLHCTQDQVIGFKKITHNNITETILEAINNGKFNMIRSNCEKIFGNYDTFKEFQEHTVNEETQTFALVENDQNLGLNVVEGTNYFGFHKVLEGIQELLYYGIPTPFMKALDSNNERGFFNIAGEGKFKGEFEDVQFLGNYFIEGILAPFAKYTKTGKEGIVEDNNALAFGGLRDKVNNLIKTSKFEYKNSNKLWREGIAENGSKTFAIDNSNIQVMVKQIRLQDNEIEAEIRTNLNGWQNYYLRAGESISNDNISINILKISLNDYNGGANYTWVMIDNDLQNGKDDTFASVLDNNLNNCIDYYGNNIFGGSQETDKFHSVALYNKIPITIRESGDSNNTYYFRRDNSKIFGNFHPTDSEREIVYFGDWDNQESALQVNTNNSVQYYDTEGNILSNTEVENNIMGVCCITSGNNAGSFKGNWPIRYDECSPGDYEVEFVSDITDTACDKFKN